MDENYKHIELRSEKTRHFIGAMPPWIMRYGTSILFALTIIFLAAAYYIPYPESIEAEATILQQENKTFRITALVPYEHAGRTETDMKILFEPEGYNHREYPMTQGKITSIDNQVTVINDNRYFTIDVTLDTNNKLQVGMSGKIHILLSQKSLFQYLFHL